MHKKGVKFGPVVELGKLVCIYLYHSTKIAKAGPAFDNRPEHRSVQIDYSSPWSEWQTQNHGLNFATFA